MSSWPTTDWWSRLVKGKQAMLVVAGLGLVVAMAPSLIVPRYGLNGYLLLVALVVVMLVVVGLRR